jgi:3-deoxy-manno-octulosonate cytidylyltransferase (CMP-KDO synthetase)
LGIIPARYGSRRFPGKPLALILGRPMFWHVWRSARRCPFLKEAFLATDDERIARAARNLAVPVVMTRGDHASGTDRVLEAAQILGAAPEDLIVNIQGDEPALQPAMLSELISPLANPRGDSDVAVATLARRVSAAAAQNPDLVKVVLDRRGRALYFSRAPIPHGRTGCDPAYWGHIGLYAFRMAALQRFVALGPGLLEQCEKLEQLRFLENGISIQVVPTVHICQGVDRPEDIPKVVQLLERETNRLPS